MFKNPLIYFFIIFFFPFGVSADFNISEYKFYKDILRSSENAQYIKIDKDIYKNANLFFSDLRIINQNNKEIPYKIFKNEDKIESTVYELELPIIKKEKSLFVLDRGTQTEYFGKIKVKTNSIDFSRKVNIYGSNSLNSKFEKLNSENTKIIENSPTGTNLEINFKYNNFRYIKIIFFGNEGDFEVKSFVIDKMESKKVKGNSEVFSVPFEEIEDGDDKVQKILISISDENIPIDYFIIKTQEKDFERKIKIYSSNNKSSDILNSEKEYDLEKDYWNEKFQGDFINKVYYDDPVFKVNDNKKYYLLIIENKKEKPLVIKEILAKRYFDFIYLEDLKIDDNYKLYYGNLTSKKPNYNILDYNSEVEGKIAVLSEEKVNSFYIEKKNSFKDRKDYIWYILYGLIVLIILWFIYKVLKENKYKDKDDVDFVEKL